MRRPAEDETQQPRHHRRRKQGVAVGQRVLVRPKDVRVEEMAGSVEQRVNVPAQNPLIGESVAIVAGGRPAEPQRGREGHEDAYQHEQHAERERDTPTPAEIGAQERGLRGLAPGRGGRRRATQNSDWPNLGRLDASTRRMTGTTAWSYKRTGPRLVGTRPSLVAMSHHATAPVVLTYRRSSISIPARATAVASVECL